MLLFGERSLWRVTGSSFRASVQIKTERGRYTAMSDSVGCSSTMTAMRPEILPPREGEPRWQQWPERKAHEESGSQCPVSVWIRAEI